MNSIAEEILKYNMDIVAIQEIRWKGKGVINKKNFSLYFSGNDDRQGDYGVGFIVSRRMQKFVLAFTPINDRICTLRLKGKLHSITLVNIYAPTEAAEEETADIFYADLQAICDRTPKYDMLMILGDYNAKLGKEEMFENLFGKHSLHEETSNNGLRVAQFATANNLKVMSTHFPRKNIHKGTWMIPGSNETNQIDHVMVSKRWASDVENVRTYRGANSDSDHFLVGIHIKQKISLVTVGKTQKTTRWNTEKFREKQIVQGYQQKLSRDLEEREPQEDVNNEWNSIKEAIVSAAQETLGDTTIPRNEDWFDEECREAVKDKKQARLKCLQRSTRANQEIYREKRINANRVCRRKKREALREKVEEMVEHHNQKQSRKFYKKLKEMTQEYRPKTSVLKDNQGNIISERSEILNRWREYFKGVLTVTDDDNQHHLTYYTADPYIEEPTYEEVERIIKCLKNFKAPGSDGITAELLKHGGSILWKRIHKFILQIWLQEEIPEEWTIGIIQPIHKKGDKLLCSNYRGITLLSVTYKILSGVIYNRLVKYSEDILGEYQCGFRPNRATTDQIFALRQIHEKAYEYNIDLYNLYIDFQQAFDSVNRDQMLNDLILLGIPRKYIRLIEATLKNSKAAVRINGELTNPFNINVGVRQGDALSTMLFNLTLEAVIRKLEISGYIGIKMTQICAYADDIVIISRNKTSLTGTVTKLKEEAQSRGLQINENKTKYMEISRTHNRTENLSIEDHNYQNVESFNYLGSQMNTENSISSEIKSRILSGNRCYYAYQKLLKSKIINRHLKLKIYKALIRPVVTYGCETWTLCISDEQQLGIFERKILRKIYGPVQNGDGTWRARMNHELDDLIQGANIIRFIKSRRLAWLGHAQRSHRDRTIRKVMEWKPIGRRLRGRPRKRWIDDVEEDIRVMQVRGWRRVVHDRAEWKSVSEKAKTHKGL